MFDPSGVTVPIVQAPMAGGPSTVELAAAVSGAGGLGFLAAGYKLPQMLADEIDRLRARTAGPFGVNVFVPQPAPGTAERIAAYRAELYGEAERYAVTLPVPAPEDDDHWADKIALLVRRPVPVVSFTFGAPTASAVHDLHAVHTYLIGTVTSLDEARIAHERGVDALCVQGPGAGGHRGTYDPAAEPGTTPLPELLATIRRTVPLPVLASGGLATGADIAAVLDAGAWAAQLGTAYLRTHESGAQPVYKAALADARFTETTVTRAFSGRPARGLRNGFIDRHDATAPAGYPQVNQLTRPLRAAAAARGDADGLSLWAGTGYRRATDEPAEALTARLWREAEAAR